MIALRVVLSVFVFVISCYLVLDLFINSFNIYILLSATVGYIFAKHLWPEGEKEESAWYELLELLIYLPYQAIAMSIRAIGHIIREQ